MRPALPASPSVLPTRTRGSVRNLPVSLFGAVMGLSGLALAWRQAAVQFRAPGLVGEAIGLFAVLVFLVLAAGYAAKVLRHRDAVAAEFLHPVTGNFFGTIVIALLLLSVVLEPYAARVGQAVWTLGAVATFLLAWTVAVRLLRGDGEPQQALPAWLIPGVASLDIAVTGAHLPLPWIVEWNWAAVAVGGVLAVVLFTLIFRRLVQHAPLPVPMVPSLMVLVAPFAVGFLAYTGLQGVDRFASLLFYFGLFLFLVLVPKVFRRDVPFSPGWWAISFPLAALSNAALRYAAAYPTWVLQAIAVAILLFLTVALAVLTVRTLAMALRGDLLRG